MEYDVVIWRGILSDGSICYAAICPAVCLAHGQGDTEAEALSDVADAMAVFMERIPDRVKTGQPTRDKLSELIAELADDGIICWVRQVEPARAAVAVV